MTVNVFLDGMYQIGYSLALALPKDIFEIQAFDPEVKFLRKLKREKIIKKPIGQIAHGCKNADIIIIDQPADFLELHYEAIGLNVKLGTVVIDTTPVPLYAAQLADRFLPEGTAFVSMIPAFNAEALKEQSYAKESASAELFNDSMVAVSTPPTKFKDAENVAAKIITAVNGVVVFMDPYEVQEAMVKTRLMPRYVALAMMNAVTNRPSWQDEQKIASSDYYQGTNPLLSVIELEQPELAALENSEALVRILDDVMDELKELRDQIADGNKDALRENLQEGVQQHTNWHGKRFKNQFDDAGASSDLPGNDMFQQMFLGGLGRKK